MTRPHKHSTIKDAKDVQIRRKLKAKASEEAALDLLADALAAPCRGCNGKCVDNDCFNPNKREIYPEDWESQ